MIIVIPIEPINDLHHDKIIAAFNELFINGGGQPDGTGYGDGDGLADGDGDGWGYGDGSVVGDGDGWGDGWGEFSEEWRVYPV